MKVKRENIRKALRIKIRAHAQASISILAIFNRQGCFLPVERRSRSTAHGDSLKHCLKYEKVIKASLPAPCRATTNHDKQIGSIWILPSRQSRNLLFPSSSKFVFSKERGLFLLLLKKKKKSLSESIDSVGHESKLQS